MYDHPCRAAGHAVLPFALVEAARSPWSPGSHGARVPAAPGRPVSGLPPGQL